MYSIRKNNAGPIEDQFLHIGSFKGEAKKVRALFNKAQRKHPDTSEQVNQFKNPVYRQICTHIPPDQDALAARARGEKLDQEYFNPILNVRII